MTKFTNQGVINFYKSLGNFQAFAYLTEDGNTWSGTNCPNWDQTYILFHKSHAYEIFGRMCHLLQDMSVTAHIHCNPHGCSKGMYCDYYENNTPYYHMWTADEIFTSGQTFLNPYNSWGDPLYYLMYFMNQVTDHYASGRSDGDDNYNTNCPGLSQIMSNLGLPVTQVQVNDQNCRAMHDKIFPLAIRATAGLMYWFAVETGMLSKITGSGTLISNETWSGTTTLMGSVTIPNGVSVVIQPGIIIRCPNGASLYVNGTLNAQGTSSQPITFTSTAGISPSSWGSIVFSGSGSSGSNLNYVNMQYGTEIDVTNVSNITIQNSTIQNCTNGIVGSTATASILNNKIKNVTNHGISLNNCTFTCKQNVITKTSDFAQYHTGFGILFNGGSSGTIWQNDIRGFNQGIGAIWGSSPTSYGSYSIPKNNRITNCLTGLVVYAQSYPVFGTPPPSDYMWNSIYGNTYNVAVGVSNSTYSSQLTAYGNWWGSNPPNTSLFSVGANSLFYYNPYRTIDPWSGIPLPSVIASGNSSNEISLLQKVSEQGIIQTNPSSSQNPTEPLLEGIELRNKDNYKDAKDFFLSYLSKHMENQAAYVELYNCYNEETASEIISYFSSLPAQAAKEHKLLLSNLYLKQGDVNLAKKVLDDIIHENPNTPLTARGKLNNIFIALNNDNDFNSAASIFTDVLKKPNLSTDIDLSLTKEMIETYAVTHGKSKPNFNIRYETDILSPATIDINNYPNPFNPSTVVRYQLSAVSSIKLIVYDILGREVATLANGIQEAGYHTATFDGSRLTSGVYFVRFTAQPADGSTIVSKTMKILMMK